MVVWNAPAQQRALAQNAQEGFIDMLYRDLGKTGLKVSAISMGCWPIVGDAIWGPQDKAEALAALHTSLDAGINFFDSAEGYGDGYSEELLGEAFGAMRSKVIIASKVSPSHFAPAALRAACEASLRRLRSDYIDVYYLHWPNHTIPIAETLHVMQTLRAEGKILHIALSNFGARDLPEALQHAPISVNELPYNLLWRAIEFDILPLCQKHAVSITAYMPLMQGLLAGKFKTAADVPDSRARTRHFASTRAQTRHGEAGAEAETFAALDAIRAIADNAGMTMAEVALAWVLSRPMVASVIVGVRNPAQVRANIAALERRLPADMLRALDAASEPLKQQLGANPDMWQSGEATRYR